MRGYLVFFVSPNAGFDSGPPDRVEAADSEGHGALAAGLATGDPRCSSGAVADGGGGDADVHAGERGGRFAGCGSTT